MFRESDEHGFGGFEVMKTYGILRSTPGAPQTLSRQCVDAIVPAITISPEELALECTNCAADLSPPAGKDVALYALSFDLRPLGREESRSADDADEEW